MCSLPVQLALMSFVVLGVLAVWKYLYEKQELKENLKWDLVFLAGFVLFLVIRFVTLGIVPSSEKFMNSAILASIMQNPVVTPALLCLSLFSKVCGWWIHGGHLPVSSVTEATINE